MEEHKTVDMSPWEHLEELRKRLVKVFYFFAILFAVCFYFSKDLFAFLQRPLLLQLSENSSFIATNPLSGWFLFLKVALFGALSLVIPFIFFQVFQFINPGLKENEKKWVWPITTLFSLFFYAGMFFSFYLVIPIVMQFLSQVYDGTDISFLPNIEDYFSFVLKLLFGFGILFDLPFFILAILQTGLVQITTFQKYRPHIYVSSFVFGAILTPPDIVSQIMMAIPFIVLFEFGLVLSKVISVQKKDIS